MAGDPTWDFQDPASKNRLLGVLRREIDEMFELAAEPARYRLGIAAQGDRRRRRHMEALPDGD